MKKILPVFLFPALAAASALHAAESDSGETARQLFREADVCLTQLQAKKALEFLGKIRTNAAFKTNDRIDATLKSASVLFSLLRAEEALALLKSIEKEPELTPKRKGRLLLQIGDAVMQGRGYYPNLSDADYRTAYDSFRKASEIQSEGKRVFYSAAMKKIIQSLYKRGKYDECLAVCEETINTKKAKIESEDWREIKTYLGHCRARLGDYEGAIADFEMLRDMKYKPGDTCRFLGQIYSQNRQYALAIGAYDEALKALEHAEDDRPQECKNWIGRLRWFANDNNLRKLQKVMAEKGEKSAPPKKKKPKTLKDIEAETGSLAEDGLDIGF